MDSQILPAATGKNFAQTISFKGSESIFTVTIVAEDVKVNCSPGNHNHGSSKVKLTNVVDYNWEPKYYTGQLLAVHVSGKYFAYGIKGKGGGMVRVASTNDTRLRALIKEMSGQVQDLSFAHIDVTVILGCVDDEGNLFIHKVEEEQDSLSCTLLVHIVQPDAQANLNSIHRVVWCPFLPEEDDCDEDSNFSTLLVLTHGNKAELFNINIIHNKYGPGPVCLSDLSEGYLEINEHSQPIMDAAFSPDGTAVATASMDGYVKFFQIYMQEGKKPPRCLHEWQPHDGRPLSYLDFLDNHSIYSPDEQFWKFAVTGCNNNTELKVWSCQTWSCLQTINFVLNPASTIKDMFLKARLDLSSTYLILSEINTRILYILEMHRDQIGAKAFATSISEFLLPASFLSFGIIEASSRNFRCSNSTEDLYPCEENDDFDDGQNIVANIIRMYVVQPKRLQECQIAYQSDSSRRLNSIGNPMDMRQISQDGLSDRSSETLLEPSESNHTQDSIEKVQLSQLTNMLPNDLPKQHFNDLQNLLIQPTTQPLNLMTPDAFSSPVKNDNEATIKKDVPSPNVMKMNTSNELKNLGAIDSVPSSTTIETDILFQRSNKENFASGGSSPSREVQEILSLNNSNYSAHEYYEDEKVTEDNSKKNGSYTQGDTYQNNSVYTEAPSMTTDWPTVPIIKAKEVLKTEEIRLNLQDCVLSSGDNIEHMSALRKDNNVEVLQELIVTLMSTVREQSTQLQTLQSEVKNLKLLQEKRSIPEDMENIIEKQLDLALARSHAQQTKLFEHWVNAKTIKDREYQESMTANMTHLITKQIHEKMQSTVNLELKQSVLPVIGGTFENLKHILQADFQQKLNSLDQLIEESLNRLLSSKVVGESLSNNLTPVIRPNMEKCYKEVVSNYLIPSWEKACNNMFLQIHDTFTQGTKEYTSSVESYMEKQRKQQEKGRELINQMSTLNEVMSKCSEKLSTTVHTDLQKQLLTSMLTMQDKIVQSISETVKEQIAVAFRNHAASLEDSVVNAVRSRAVTPSPHVIDTQVVWAQVQQLLAQGHINTAFQQALSASDLSLVVHLCERVNPQVVFGEHPCPLQQHVLLSLIQQLSADMNNHTELKHKFLEEAVLNLDPNNPVTKEHMSTVLRDLNRQLLAYITNNPTSKITKNMKMLQMAAQSLLKS